jgi:peptidoglycan-associated lipoprotein
VGGTSATCPTVTVLFDTDSSGLSVAARDALGRAVSCLSDSGTAVQIEGHADERGTTEYNIALGQRRADAVATFLVDGGVARGRLEIASYGEERPADPGHGPQSWAANRRATVGPAR